MHHRVLSKALPTAVLLMMILSFTIAPLSSLASPPSQGSSIGQVSTHLANELTPLLATEKAPNALDRLNKATGGKAVISMHPATGAARFVRFYGAAPAQFNLTGVNVEEAKSKALAFLSEYGAAFGLRNPSAELRLESVKIDTTAGGAHVTYNQFYGNVPVFAGMIKVHFNAKGQLSAVNGTIVPDITLPKAPAMSKGQAEQAAIKGTFATDVQAINSELVVYRLDLAKGVPGINVLAYTMEVTNRADVRDFVAVDAQSGQIVDRYTLLEEVMTRKLYESEYDPSALVWTEGDSFPGSLNADQQNILVATEDSYNFFKNMVGYISYDNADAPMEIVNNDPTIQCPNANWNGVTTNYCNGVTSDDVVAHEWGHAYTEYTHGLIYAWQSGALNEAYSDIWGETVDLLNSYGTDTPQDAVRTVGFCSNESPAKSYVDINSPASLAGQYGAGTASFGPALTASGLTGNVVRVVDGSGDTDDGCEALTNGAQLSGNIALIERGTCAFTIKTKNAQDAGAIGVLIYNNTSGIGNMSGSDATITIPAVMIGQGVGQQIATELGNSQAVNIKMYSGAESVDNSIRWLQGEDSSAFGGAIRDLWNPNCYSDPAYVTDTTYYHCSTTDGGGVHSNSGIPNRGYALLVDGGTTRGQTINAIGMVKAAHIYWRAQALYQTPSSDFADHADALEQACTDLTGTNLEGLSVTATPAGPSGQMISASDCAEVAKMITALDLRTNPAQQCGFQPMLEQNAPALCPTGTTYTELALETFETSNEGWTVSHNNTYDQSFNYDWERTSTLPGSHTGTAFYAYGGGAGNCSSSTGDSSRVMYVTSPAFVLTDEYITPGLAFDHYMASELNYDGGNLQVRVNGGSWTVVPASAFTFNDYNLSAMAAAPGNTSPLAGQPGFSGADGGTNASSWGQSQVDLSSFASAGDTIELRYAFGADGCGGNDGWYVDNVTVYTCVADTPGSNYSTFLPFCPRN